MTCYKCGSEIYQAKSEFGFYYRFSKCGRIFETKSQKKNTSEWFKNRSDYVGHNNQKKQKN